MTLLERIKNFISGKQEAETFSRESLLQAVKDAADDGDVQTIEAVAKLISKQQKAIEDANAEKEVADSQPETLQEDVMQTIPDDLANALAENQIDFDTVVSFDGSSLVVSKDGNERTISVSKNEDGTWSIMDSENDDTQEVQQNTEETQATLETTTLASTAKPNRPIVVTLDASRLTNTNEAWVNIANLGEYVHDEYGMVEFTREKFDSWKRNLTSGVMGGKLSDGTYGIAVDYNHSMDINASPNEQKAAGYLKDLKLELDGDIERVFAFIEFTPKAAEGIRNKEWAWFSISEVSNFTDQKTGKDVGNTLLGGALTNRPFVNDLMPIQLSDLRPSKAMTLARELAKEKADRQAAEKKLFDQGVTASVSALEKAGVSQFVINLSRPLLEADNKAVALTFSFGGKTQEAKPGELLQKILLEMAASGFVPQGEKTMQRTEIANAMTFSQAVDSIVKELLESDAKKGGSLREKDARKQAYSLVPIKYPHLQEVNANE
jgi:phage I-like protein